MWSWKSGWTSIYRLSLLHNSGRCVQRTISDLTLIWFFKIFILKQVETCFIRVFKFFLLSDSQTGRPELVTACRLPKVGQTEILLRCDASYNGGLSQTFHLEVFEKVPSDSMVRLMTPPINTVDGESFKSSTPPSITTSTTTTITPIAHLAASAHLPEYSTFENDASPMYTTSLTSVRLRLVHNLTNSIEPTFSIRHLKHSQPYVFRLYASNLKGRSRKTLQVTVRTLASSYNQSLDTFRSGKLDLLLTLKLV